MMDPVTILLVEDHGDTRSTLTRLLRAWGHRVCPAESATDAISVFEQRDYDAVLSDIGLPDGNGFDLMREMRSRGFAGRSVAVTAWTSEADRHAAAEAGFDDFVPKPINVAKLQKVLATIGGG
jgi:DNA-binding response OmpR family regulator